MLSSKNPNLKTSDSDIGSQSSEILIKFLWFVIHIKNPNPHTIEVVKRILKFCELVLLLAFVCALVKIVSLLVH